MMPSISAASDHESPTARTVGRLAIVARRIAGVPASTALIHTAAGQADAPNERPSIRPICSIDHVTSWTMPVAKTIQPPRSTAKTISPRFALGCRSACEFGHAGGVS